MGLLARRTPQPAKPPKEAKRTDPEADRLRQRLHDLAELLDANADRLRAAAPGSYRLQEALSERSAIEREQRIAQGQLDAVLASSGPTAADLAKEEQRQRRIEAEYQRRKREISDWADRQDEIGEFAQARIWRNELIGLRARIENEDRFRK